MSITHSMESSDQLPGQPPAPIRRKRQLNLLHCLLMVIIAALGVDLYLRYRTFVRTEELSARQRAAEQMFAQVIRTLPKSTEAIKSTPDESKKYLDKLERSHEQLRESVEGMPKRGSTKRNIILLGL